MIATLQRYAILALGVLAVALVIGCCFLAARSRISDLRADAAEQRAAISEGKFAAMKQAIARDDKSADATNNARAANDSKAAQINKRLAVVEQKAHDRPPVPVVCPSPDPDLLRELQAGSGRVRAAEDRLRGLRRPAGQSSG